MPSAPTLLQNVIARGIVANRPVAALAGRLWYATDESTFYRDNGTSWDELPTGAVDSVDGLTGAVDLTGTYEPIGAADAAVTAHVEAVDPHGDRAYADGLAINYDAAGTADAAVAAHVAELDPHPQYLTETEADAIYIQQIEKGSALGVATLDAAGFIPTDQLPGLALTTTFVVGSQALMLALAADTGDICVRTDLSETYVLDGTGDPTVLANWIHLLSPTDAVASVDGRAGVVTLNDLYDASGAAASAVSTHNGESTSVHGITNTANLVYTSDSRLTDARTPTAHKSSHATGGSDALSPNDISATTIKAIKGFFRMPENAQDTYPREHVTTTTSTILNDTALITYFAALGNLTVSNFSVWQGGADFSVGTLLRFGLYTWDTGTKTATLVARSADVKSTFVAAAGVMRTVAFDTTGGYPASYDLVAGEFYGIAVGFAGSGNLAGFAGRNTGSNTSGFYYSSGLALPLRGAASLVSSDLPTSSTFTLSGQGMPWFRLT